MLVGSKLYHRYFRCLRSLNYLCSYTQNEAQKNHPQIISQIWVAILNATLLAFGR